MCVCVHVCVSDTHQSVEQDHTCTEGREAQETDLVKYGSLSPEVCPLELQGGRPCRCWNVPLCLSLGPSSPGVEGWVVAWPLVPSTAGWGVWKGRTGLSQLSVSPDVAGHTGNADAGLSSHRLDQRTPRAGLVDKERKGNVLAFKSSSLQAVDPVGEFGEICSINNIPSEEGQHKPI